MPRKTKPFYLRKYFDAERTVLAKAENVWCYAKVKTVVDDKVLVILENYGTYHLVDHHQIRKYLQLVPEGDLMSKFVHQAVDTTYPQFLVHPETAKQQDRHDNDANSGTSECVPPQPAVKDNVENSQHSVDKEVIDVSPGKEQNNNDKSEVNVKNENKMETEIKIEVGISHSNLGDFIDDENNEVSEEYVECDTSEIGKMEQKTGKYVEVSDLDGRKLFVGGLSSSLLDEDLLIKFFTDYVGSVEAVDLDTDPFSRASGASSGVVTFRNKESVEDVLLLQTKAILSIASSEIVCHRAEVGHGKVYVKLPRITITEEIIQNLFSTYGQIVQLERPVDKSSVGDDHFCIITFKNSGSVLSLLNCGTVSFVIDGHQQQFVIKNYRDVMTYQDQQLLSSELVCPGVNTTVCKFGKEKLGCHLRYKPY